MARADREAVLRGVNARFDEAGDDDAVIKELGSPTFAAVSVLRGYTPPEEPDEEYEEEEYNYVEPTQPVAEPAADDVQSAEPDAAPETEETGETAETEEAADEPAAEVESADEPLAEATPEVEAPETVEPEEPNEVSLDDKVNKVIEEVGRGVDDESADEPSDELEPEPVVEETVDAAEPADDSGEEAEASEVAPASTFDTVDIGFDTIEVYSDATSESAVADSQPVAVAEAEPENETETSAENEASDEVQAPDEPEQGEPEAGEVDFDAIFGDKPAEEPEPEAKLRGGRVFLVALLTLIPGVPVAAVLVVVSLALLALGAALIYTGGVVISFAFLGMSVAADIMLCAGAGLFVAALGLPVLFFAVWFFLRCFVRLYSRTFARAGEWCRGEVRK